MATDAAWAKNATPIYQRLIDNTFSGYLKINADPDAYSMKSCKTIDVFKETKPETSQTPSLLGRISYINDKLIPATSWTFFYESKMIATCIRQVEYVDQPI